MFRVCAQLFNPTKGGRPPKPKLEGKKKLNGFRSRLWSIIVEQDISTLSFSHAGSKYVNSKKVWYTYICNHGICFTTSANITNKTAEHDHWPKHTSSHRNFCRQCDFFIWKIFPSFCQQCDFASNKRRGGLSHTSNMPEDGAVRCKTWGQPLIFKKVVKPRKILTAVSSAKSKNVV